MAKEIFNGKVMGNILPGISICGPVQQYRFGVVWHDLHRNSFKPFKPMQRWKTAQTGKSMFAIAICCHNELILKELKD